MTKSMTFPQPDIAVAPPARLRVAYTSQLSGENSALSTAVRAAHVATGFGADLRIAEGVPGVQPRGVPV